jgi:hypothetical protein
LAVVVAFLVLHDALPRNAAVEVWVHSAIAHCYEKAAVMQNHRWRVLALSASSVRLSVAVRLVDRIASLRIDLNCTG